MPLNTTADFVYKRIEPPPLSKPLLTKQDLTSAFDRWRHFFFRFILGPAIFLVVLLRHIVEDEAYMLAHE